MNNEEKAIIKAKRVECILGFIFLIPAILGAVAFALSLCGTSGDFVNLRLLNFRWRVGVEDAGCMPVAPIYMGILAFVGAYLVKDNIKYLFINIKDYDDTEGYDEMK